MPRRRQLALILLAIAAAPLAIAGIACGSGGSGTVLPEPTPSGAAAPRPTTAANQPPPRTDGSLPSVPAGAYEVHEWGLMRQAAGDVLDVGAVAPPVRREPLVVDKPVLYFHAGSSMRVSRVEVHATGDIIEHWPLTATGTPRGVAWSDVALDVARRAGSASCAPGAYPTSAQPPCTNVRGQTCESSGLGPLAADAACLAVGGAAHPFLFYRSRTRTLTPSLRLDRTSSGEIRATNMGDHAIPGLVVSIRRRGGGVVARAFAPPAPHQSMELVERAAVDDEDDGDRVTADMPVMPSDVENGRRAVRMTMRALGMTDGEIDAFLRAWDAQLFSSAFGQNIPTDELSVDRRGPIDIPPAPVDSVLYFLPSASCDGVATLSFAPAPRAVRRAIAVWGAVR